MSQQRVKVSIEIEFEDIADYKMHQSAINSRINAFLKRGGDDLKTGTEESAWSSHKYSIEVVEKE